MVQPVVPGEPTDQDAHGAEARVAESEAKVSAFVVLLERHVHMVYGQWPLLVWPLAT